MDGTQWRSLFTDQHNDFYAVIPAVLEALGDTHVHISLMTAMHTSRPSTYDFVTWKRRAERLVRASGEPVTDFEAMFAATHPDQPGAVITQFSVAG